MLSWLQDRAPSLAEPYRGAVALLATPGFPGRVNFIALVIRDIPDRLLDILRNEDGGSRVDIPQRLRNEIVPLWQPLTAAVKDTAAQPGLTVEITVQLAKRLDDLVADVQQTRDRKTKFELLFQVLMLERNPNAEASERTAAELLKVVKWFNSKAHIRNTEMTVDEAELVQQFERLEGVLHSFVGDFFTAKADLDAILQQTNERAGG